VDRFLQEFFTRFEKENELIDKIGFNPYYQSLSSGVNGIVTAKGEEYFDLASNNYLGLANDKRVVSAMKSALEEYGASMCGTPIACGYADLLKELEAKVSEFLGTEDSLVFPSGYQANVALLSNIADKQDVILIDHYAHASLIQGVIGSGCKIKPFKHNSMEHLEKLLQKTEGYKKRFVVTESVFSTEGCIAPLARINELCRQYEAIPVVDDSHGIGAIGKNGRGILEEQGISNFQGIYTASLGKAIGVAGGVVSGSSQLIKFLRYTCAGLIYSTAIPPVLAAGAISALNILVQNNSLINRLRENSDSILKLIVETGFELIPAQAPIISIRCHSTENCLILAKILYDNKILCTPFIPPSVAPNSSVIRLIAGAGLKSEHIRELAEIIPRVAKQYFAATASGE